MQIYNNKSRRVHRTWTRNNRFSFVLSILSFSVPRREVHEPWAAFPAVILGCKKQPIHQNCQKVYFTDGEGSRGELHFIVGSGESWFEGLIKLVFRILCNVEECERNVFKSFNFNQPRCNNTDGVSECWSMVNDCLRSDRKCDCCSRHLSVRRWKTPPLNPFASVPPSCRATSGSIASLTETGVA